MPASIDPLLPATAPVGAAVESSPAPIHLLGLTLDGRSLAVIEGALEATGAIAVAVLLLRLVPVLERSVLRKATRAGTAFDESSAELEQRKETLTRVTGSVARVVIWAATIVLVLGSVGISVAPLVAGAGIAGVAVGFGAQSIVKDFFSGFFILFEDQFSVGDTVTISGITGSVERMTLRITVLRDALGTAYFIPNSNISNVANKTHGFTRVTLEASFGPLVPEEKITSTLHAVGTRVKAREGFAGVLLEDPVVEGPVEVVAGAETWRVVIKAAADRSAEVKRAALSALRHELAAAGLGYEAGVIVERTGLSTPAP